MINNYINYNYINLKKSKQSIFGNIPKNSCTWLFFLPSAASKMFSLIESSSLATTMNLCEWIKEND